MNTVGIDLHRRRSHVAVIDDQGELRSSVQIDNDRATFLELLDSLEGETQVAVEATYGWEWLAELLEDAGYETHLAHPKGTKAITSARVMNDAVDALTLAKLLRAGMLPEAYIAPRELRGEVASGMATPVPGHARHLRTRCPEIRGGLWTYSPR